MIAGNGSEDTNLKKRMCAMLLCAFCVCMLTGCGRKAVTRDASPQSDAPTAVQGEPEVTSVPDEGYHGEEDQSKVLEEMPTLAPVQTIPDGDDAHEDGSSDDYFSVDELIQRTEEFDTYDETTHTDQQAGTSVIDPSAMQFSSLEDTTMGFTFNYPTNWVNVPGVYTVCYREQVEPGDFPARVSITGKLLVHTPEGTVLNDQLTEFVRTIYKQYDTNSFQLGTANPEDTFMGKQAVSNTYLAYSGDTEVKGFIIGRAFGRKLYVFHFCASYDDYKSLEKVMRYMVKSVQLVED